VAFGHLARALKMRFHFEFVAAGTKSWEKRRGIPYLNRHVQSTRGRKGERIT
jgi:hypothetical protein